MQESEETLLLSIARHSDRPAFEALARQVERQAFGVAMRITGRREMAEEAVQEALLKVWLSASAYQPTGSARAWILRIVANESLMLLRALRKASREKEYAPMPQTEREDRRAVEILAGQERTAACRDFFERLPFREQQVLALHYAGGLTQQEIACELDLPARTVSSRIEKALERLRANLTQAGLAAAAPLLEAEELSQVIGEGFSVPQGLLEKVLARVPAAAHESIRTAASQSRRAAPAQAGSPALLVAGLAATLLAAGAAWWAGGSKPAAPLMPSPAPSEPPQVMPSPAAPVPSKTEPFFRSRKKSLLRSAQRAQRGESQRP